MLDLAYTTHSRRVRQPPQARAQLKDEQHELKAYEDYPGPAHGRDRLPARPEFSRSRRLQADARQDRQDVHQAPLHALRPRQDQSIWIFEVLEKSSAAINTTTTRTAGATSTTPGATTIRTTCGHSSRRRCGATAT